MPADPRPGARAHDGSSAPLYGTVNQVMGDGIMALFGGPLPPRRITRRGLLRRAPDAKATAHHAHQVQQGEGVLVQIRAVSTPEKSYGTLLKQRRRLLHGQIVGVIEQVYVERIGEQIERLAFHPPSTTHGGRSTSGWTPTCHCFRSVRQTGRRLSGGASVQCGRATTRGSTLPRIGVLDARGGRRGCSGRGPSTRR